MKAKSNKKKNYRKIPELEIKVKCLKEHKEILTTLQEMREEVQNEKWANIKDDMENFLENPEDDELRMQLLCEYEAMVEDASEQICDRDMDDDTPTGEQIHDGSFERPKSPVGEAKDDQDINKEINASEPNQKPGEDSSNYTSFENVLVGTILEAKDVFDQWQASIVQERKSTLKPVQILVDVNGFELAFNEDPEGLANLAPYGTNIPYNRKTIEKLQKRLTQKKDKKTKGNKKPKKPEAPKENVMKKEAKRKKSQHQTSIDSKPQLSAEWAKNDPLEKPKEKQAAVLKEDFEPLPSVGVISETQHKFPDDDPILKSLEASLKTSPKQSSKQKERAVAQSTKTVNRVTIIEPIEPEPEIKEEVEETIPFVNMFGETGVTVEDLMAASFANIPTEADITLNYRRSKAQQAFSKGSLLG